jgi:penicillin amidase
VSDSDPTAGLRALAAAALFPTDGELTLDGLREPVSVRRDAWGVPYVEGASLDDLWFAQGVVTAGERLFQLDLTLRAANGRLSEVFGERTLEDDRFARTVGFHRAGARLADGWDDDSVRMHERFRAGVAAWVDVMPSPPVEYTMLDLRPELPEDVGAWAAAFVFLSWGLSGNALQELLRAQIAERDGADAAAWLLPPAPDDPWPELLPGALHGTLFDAVSRPGGRGSNAWVLAPSRTSTGGALLANDPHLEAVQPGVWLEMHLSAPGYRARGVALPWTPGIVLGTTAHHAWGATNVSGDVQDLFLEELADDGLSVRRGDGWSPVIVHPETIGVRGADAVELTVRETSHGPLLDRFPMGEGEVEHVSVGDLGPPGTAVALAWTGLEHGIQPSLAVRAAVASSFEEFREAVRSVSCPGQNFVYADVDGTIGYTCTGVYPVRRAGDGTVPVPAADGEHAWIGTVDPDDLPWGVDPARGYLVSANNRPHGDDYPHLIGRDFHPPHRAERIARELEGHDLHDVTSAAALQTDTVSPPARRIVECLRGAAVAPRTDAQRLGLDLVLGWNGDVGADSAAAALFQVWSGHVARKAVAIGADDELFTRYHADREVWHCRVLPDLAERALDGDPDMTDLVLDAFDDAVAELRSRLGGDPRAWRWGALHRVRLAHPLAAIPGLEDLFTAVDAEVGGDESTVAQMAFDSRSGSDVVVIPSWRAVYDLADLDRSVGVLPAGVSGNPASPHWNDQAPLWLAGRTHPLPFTSAAVEDATVSLARLVPATISA